MTATFKYGDLFPESMLLPFEERKKNVLVRREATSDERFGCRPEDRKTEDIVDYGIVVVDKPKGPTSHQVSAFVQHILTIDKSGHGGTLDPGVTGVLPVALGRGTRVVQALLSAGKEYIAVMHLHKEVEESVLRETMNAFVGKIIQLPPVKSAVKRAERERSVYYVDIIEIEGKDVLFRVGCEAGTYIRKLIHDIGEALGCGAHMAELRRTKAGPFDDTQSFSLQELADAYFFWKKEGNDRFLRKVILPIETGVAHVSKVWIFDSAIESVCHGVDVKVPGIVRVHDDIKAGDIVAIMSLKDELVGLGVAQIGASEMVKEEGVAVKTHKVFMEPKTYTL